MIGILAGMGPKSTAPFVEQVVSLCQEKYGAKNDMDFPPMMIYSCPTPFYLNQSLDHAAMRTAIVVGAQRLAAAGIDYLAVPCNTAHIYFAAIEQAVNVPVLHMVRETCRHLPAHCRKAALLATTGTVQSGIYQSILADSDIACIVEERWQQSVNQILTLIKSGSDPELARACWVNLLTEIAAKADAAVIACTDLNVVHTPSDQLPPCVDSAACLAEALVDRYYLNRKG